MGSAVDLSGGGGVVSHRCCWAAGFGSPDTDLQLDRRTTEVWWIRSFKVHRTISTVWRDSKLSHLQSLCAPGAQIAQISSFFSFFRGLECSPSWLCWLLCASGSDLSLLHALRDSRAAANDCWQEHQGSWSCKHYSYYSWWSSPLVNHWWGIVTFSLVNQPLLMITSHLLSLATGSRRRLQQLHDRHKGGARAGEPPDSW